MYIIICILLFGFLIAIHEFGHFIVAKACGVKVNEFSIGMGPLLLHRQGRETQYSLRLLPIGGFCAMEGEDEDSDDERAFRRAAPWKQFLILVAGAAFNFLTGLIIVLCLYASMTTYTEPVLSGFMDGFPLEGEAYLMEGDEILAINGRRVLLTGDISTILALENSETVDVTVRRNGETRVIEDLPLVPREYQVDGQTVTRYGLLFTAKEATVFDRIKVGCYTSVNFVRNVFWSFEMLFDGRAGFQDLSGPVHCPDYEPGGGGVPQCPGGAGEYPLSLRLYRGQPGGDEPAAPACPGRRPDLLPAAEQPVLSGLPQKDSGAV